MKKSTFIVLMSLMITTTQSFSAGLSTNEINTTKIEIQNEIVSKSEALGRLKNEVSNLEQQIQNKIDETRSDKHSRNIDLIITGGSILSTLIFGYRSSTVVNDPQGLEVAITTGLSFLSTITFGVASVGNEIKLICNQNELPKLKLKLSETQLRITNLEIQLKKDFLALE